MGNPVAADVNEPRGEVGPDLGMPVESQPTEDEGASLLPMLTYEAMVVEVANHS